MANEEQVAILRQGVAAWNRWREENPDAEIDLSWAILDNQDLSKANFSKADIRSASFMNSRLTGANFSKSILGCQTGQYGPTNFMDSDLTCATFDNSFVENGSESGTHIFFLRATLDYTSWVNFQAPFGETNVFEDSNNDVLFEGTKLVDDNIRKLLWRGKGQSLSLKSKNLKNTLLVNFDLRGVDLRETNLLQANLSGADITGAKLWGSARENWIIDGIRCEYVYWDEAGEVRTPPDRDFRPGEFEELYKQLPSFEYVFAQGFTPLDPLIMDRVVQAINEQHKEFSLELVNFDKRGEPHATFTVCRLDYVEKAKKSVTKIYEKTIEYLRQENEEKNRLIERQNNFIDQLIKKTPSIEDLKQMGDTCNINIYGGQIGAVGQSASASGNIFQQITPELSHLHEEMRNAAANPAQNAAADEVAKAEQAAKQQDEPKMRQHLKNAGKFAVDCAQKIGSEALAEYLKKMTLGM
jgi:uncharacterized protein YjbI with pentapeptide repeats